MVPESGRIYGTREWKVLCFHDTNGYMVPKIGRAVFRTKQTEVYSVLGKSRLFGTRK